MTDATIDDATIVNDDGTTNNQNTGPKIKFGFVVLVDTDGTMYIERNKAAIANVDIERDATLMEVRRYAQEIIFDLAAQAAAEYTSLRLAPTASQTPPQEPTN
jgi:nucleoside-diphosphate-sugar epimerase